MVAEQLARLPPTKANRAQSPAGVTGFPQVGIVPDDGVGRRVFSGISRFPGPFIPTPRRSILTSINLIGSQVLAVKSHPNLFTHSRAQLSVEQFISHCVEETQGGWRAAVNPGKWPSLVFDCTSGTPFPGSASDNGVFRGEATRWKHLLRVIMASSSVTAELCHTEEEKRYEVRILDKRGYRAEQPPTLPDAETRAIRAGQVG
ncbi:hypothetical protein PR048_032518 [Dryococelus australis]|uniref:Uncharacterized protein n=1 Tax=Dryococelus australis TaxID=614101 RepID=A0ABQ9G3L1_9NEOP|nr:hypothetical protein PR048_032518 [Dryococelus australis]